MKRIYLDPTQPPTLNPMVMTIGNFDGVHLGHQAMIAKVRALAKAKGCLSAVMVFEPQPKEFFDPVNAPARLSSLDEKHQILANLGVDVLIVARFDRAFAALSANEFCRLLKRMQVQHLVLGDDFRFGRGRVGDKDFLLQAGFGVDSLDSVIFHAVRVSSTRVRHHLAKGELDASAILLGRDYTMTGMVVHGDKLGRDIGFPTANLTLNRNHPAPLGVFAVDVCLLDDAGRVVPFVGTDFSGGVTGLTKHSLFGAANLGTRPSVDGNKWRFEVHLPKFSGDLYGRQLQVRFLHYLHAERTYAGLDALTQGISDDVAALLAWRAEQP